MSIDSALSARRLRELFENIPDGVYETSPDGRILAANRALVRMLGYSSEEELRRTGAASLYLDPDQRRATSRILTETGRLVNAELQLRRRDGSILHVLENARAVRDDSGAVICYQGTLTDISDRKRTEEELRKARDAALEASRLKSRFLANISHELRTPLNAVLGMSQILLSMPCGDDVRNCAETIHLSAKMLLDHITEILDFSRIEAGRIGMECAPFSIREVIHQSASMLAARAADKGLTLLAWAEPAVPREAVGDPARLQQVLVNLLSNAVKFTDQGEVELTARRIGESGGRQLIRFSVRDTGPGIPESAAQIIFEPFRQGDDSMTRRHGGTGLGLAIVKEIVEAMGSHIQLRSQWGEGSEFLFDLALPCEEAAGEPPLAGAAAIVEPNASGRRMLETWLKAWGLRVHSFADTPALLEFAASAAGLRGLRAVVACDSAIHQQFLEDYRAVFDALAPAPVLILLTKWGQQFSSAALPPLAAVLKSPVCESELRLAVARACAPAAASLHALAEAVEAVEKRARVLVAEDNATNQTVIRRMLEKLGCEAQIAQHGRAAVAAAAAAHFDLILMDCQMPEMDGFRATAAIRAAEPPGRRTPIIAITAHASNEDERACLAAGMDDYLSKPVMLECLRRKLDAWLPGKAQPAPTT